MNRYTRLFTSLCALVALLLAAQLFSAHTTFASERALGAVTVLRGGEREPGDDKGGKHDGNDDKGGKHGGDTKKSSRVEIKLSGSATYSSAKGKARYSNRSGEREFQVEVEHLTKLKGQTLTVFVNGSSVGSLKVSNLGAGKLNRNSARGNGVPTISAGSRVEVKTSTGVLVSSGRFS